MQRQEVTILAIFLVAQVLDGALTYVGVREFGLQAEGNALLTTLMQAWGTGPALIAAKLLASLCGLILFSVSVYRLLAAAAGACIGFAVIPWMAHLTWHCLL